MTLSFGATRATLKYNDVSSARIWDTARDNDNGKWREYWRDSGRSDEVLAPTIRTIPPATMVVVGRTGIISIVSASDPLQLAAPDIYDNTFMDIRGPLTAATACVAHAADGMVAVRCGTNVYLFDFYTRQIFKITTAGTYLCTPPADQKWTERWPSEVLTQISTSALTASATGAIVCSRANVMYDRPVGRPVARPFVFVEAGAYVAGITPNGGTIRWGQSGWAAVYQLDTTPSGEIIFRGGATESTTVACVVKPDNWLWGVGSDTAVTNADITFGTSGKVVYPAGSYITAGNDEVGVRNRSNNSLLIADMDLNLGGQRALCATTFGPKTPGSLLLMNCSGGSPETDVYRANADFTKSGTPTTTVLKGLNFWGGWSTGNYLQSDYAGGTVNLAVQTLFAGNWSATCRVVRTGTCDDDVIYEYAYAPSSYSGHGFKLCIISNVVHFRVTTNGYSGLTADIAPFTGELPLNVPVSITVGYDNGIYYASIDGVLDTAAAAQVINANSIIRVGLGVDGAKPLDNARINGLCFSKNGTRLAAERCTQENLNTIREANHVEMTSAVYEMCGADDEFDAYFFKNTTHMYKVQQGEIVSDTPLRNIGCAGVTNLKLEVRGWRAAAAFTDAASVPRARLQNATIVFDRSEYENILTNVRNKPSVDWAVEFSMDMTNDKVGPRFGVRAGAQTQYDIDIIIVAKDGVVRRLTGLLQLRRASSGNAIAVISTAALGSTITNVDVTATGTADGAYLTFVHGTDKETNWIVRINRVDRIFKFKN